MWNENREGMVLLGLQQAPERAILDRLHQRIIVANMSATDKDIGKSALPSHDQQLGFQISLLRQSLRTARLRSDLS